MKISTANKNGKRAHRRRVLAQSFFEDLIRYTRQMKSGTLHKRANSYFTRRMKRARRNK